MSKLQKYWLYLAVITFIVIVLINYKASIFIEMEGFANWAYPKEENKNGKVFQLVLNMLAGIGIMIGLFVAHRRAKAMEAGVEKQSEALDHQSKQIELTRKAQTDERFKNAIEHLGSEKSPIILGGIAELHQIAVDSKESYAEVVSNILCSYIRTEAHKDNSAKNINKTAINTIVKCLFKGHSNIEYPYKGLKSDLSFTNLNFIDFDDVYIENSNFSFCHLPYIKNAEFKNVSFSSGTFWVSQLKNIKFDSCNLFQTFFNSVSMENIKITNIVSGAPVFINSELKKVSFNEMSFFKIDFLSCEFNECEFFQTKFSHSNFYGSSFKNVDLFTADINNCNFDGVGFEDVVMSSSTVSSRFNGCQSTSQFYRYRLNELLSKRIGEKADLSKVDFEKEDFRDCNFGELTKDRLDEIEKYLEVIEEKYSKGIVKPKEEKESGK